jgi:hypothetical protein
MYHSLCILLRRPFLTSADLHLRKMALDTCLVHSEMIHAIYTVYTHTFPHRLMTYQVSYCIYTAATVEAQVLKTAASQNERNGAAARLSDALRVLQNEAVHTPGSGRSLDTIRRLLNSGRSSAQYSQCGQQPVSLPFSVSEGLERRSSQLVQTPADEHLLHASYATPHTTPAVSSAHSAGINDDGSYFAIANGVLWGDEYRYGGTNTGAGYQPNAHHWAATSSTDNHARGIGFGSVWWHEAHRGVGSM